MDRSNIIFKTIKCLKNHGVNRAFPGKRKIFRQQLNSYLRLTSLAINRNQLFEKFDIFVISIDVIISGNHIGENMGEPKKSDDKAESYKLN